MKCTIAPHTHTQTAPHHMLACLLLAALARGAASWPKDLGRPQARFGCVIAYGDDDAPQNADPACAKHEAAFLAGTRRDDNPWPALAAVYDKGRAYTEEHHNNDRKARLMAAWPPDVRVPYHQNNMCWYAPTATPEPTMQLAVMVHQRGPCIDVMEAFLAGMRGEPNDGMSEHRRRDYNRGAAYAQEAKKKVEL